MGKAHHRAELLAHQAGLYALDVPIDRRLVADVDRLAVVLARQKPAWEPGTRQAYHGITLGFYQSELLRRIDPPPHARPVLPRRDRVAAGLDVYIRLPEDVTNSRLATIARPTAKQMLLGFPPRLAAGHLQPAVEDRQGVEGIRIASRRAPHLRAQPRECRREAASGLPGPSRVPIATLPRRRRLWACVRRRWSGLRAGCSADLWVLGRVPEGGGAVLARLHEAQPLTCRLAATAVRSGPRVPVARWALPIPGAGVGYAYVTSQMGTRIKGDPRDVACGTHSTPRSGANNPLRTNAGSRPVRPNAANRQILIRPTTLMPPLASGRITTVSPSTTVDPQSGNARERFGWRVTRIVFPDRAPRSLSCEASPPALR